MPDFSYENKLWKKGINVIAGLDEVGRGSLAGPVVTAFVSFNKNTKMNILINDSKKMSAKNRELANNWIKRNAINYGIGKASVAEINRHGIVKATNMAFRRALKNSHTKVDYLLIDAFYIPNIRGLRRTKQLPIIKGDSKSYSIAAASIIAKVYRDELMTKLSQNKKYSSYCWHKNKGYGTKEHRDAIAKYGLTNYHRKLFTRKIV
ncbi:MAG TPA: ribonuclease HII [Patescibacteria group bacterium]|nr:ribonuclease HII [Patescibacteria group bacterium]